MLSVQLGLKKAFFQRGFPYSLFLEKFGLLTPVAECPIMAISRLNHRTGTTTAFIRKADIRVRFALSAHQISN
jgi:hypothetical protein